MACTVLRLFWTKDQVIISPGSVTYIYWCFIACALLSAMTNTQQQPIMHKKAARRLLLLHITPCKKLVNVYPVTRVYHDVHSEWVYACSATISLNPAPAAHFLLDSWCTSWSFHPAPQPCPAAAGTWDRSQDECWSQDLVSIKILVFLHCYTQCLDKHRVPDGDELPLENTNNSDSFLLS